MNSESNENAIIQNLKDAGCNQDMITAFINDLKEGYIDDGMELLAAHRRLLLEELHREQKQIDCLDYLVYKMKKTKKVKA